MGRYIVLYHANCTDGFTAAWAIYRTKLPGTVEYFAYTYGDPFPVNPRGAHVIYVDLSDDYESLRSLIDDTGALSVTVIDHHASAYNRDIPPANLHEGIGLAAMSRLNNLYEGNARGVSAFLDTTHSGAVLAWSFFRPSSCPPKLSLYVEDYDLWSFLRPHTKVYNAVLWSYLDLADFDIWDTLAAKIERDDRTTIQEGNAILRSRKRDVEFVLKRAFYETIESYVVPVVNVDRSLANDVGAALLECTNSYFAVMYYDDGQRRNFSLRSAGSSTYCVDMSDIAERFGGGGHPTSAGFSIPLREDHYLLRLSGSFRPAINRSAL